MSYDLIAENAHDPENALMTLSRLDFQPLWAFLYAQHEEHVPGDVFLAVAQGANVRISPEKVSALVDALDDDLDRGVVDNFVEQHSAMVASLDLIECDACDGTGVRTDEMARRYGLDLMPLDDAKAIVLGRDRGTCNLCDGFGKAPNPIARFRFSIATVRRFVEFLRTSNGLSITNDERG